MVSLIIVVPVCLFFLFILIFFSSLIMLWFILCWILVVIILRKALTTCKLRVDIASENERTLLLFLLHQGVKQKANERNDDR